MRGLSIVEEKKIRTENYVFVERVRVIETLFIFATGSSEEKCQKKETAVSVLIVLYRLQKNYSFCRKKNSSTIKSERKKTAQIIFQQSSFFVSFPIECLPTQYIICLNNKVFPALKYLCLFSSYNNLKQHFYRKYLHYYSDR